MSINKIKQDLDDIKKAFKESSKARIERANAASNEMSNIINRWVFDLVSLEVRVIEETGGLDVVDGYRKFVALSFGLLRKDMAIDGNMAKTLPYDAVSLDNDDIVVRINQLEKSISQLAGYAVDSKSNGVVRRLVWEKTNGLCVYCDQRIDHPEEIGPRVMHVDHLVPVACGGPDSFANYVPACQPCNSSKSNRDPVDFVLSLRGVERPNVVPIRNVGDAS